MTRRRARITRAALIVAIFLPAACSNTPAPSPDGERPVSEGHQPVGTWLVSQYTDPSGALVSTSTGVRPGVEISSSSRKEFWVGLGTDCNGISWQLAVDTTGHLTVKGGAAPLMMCGPSKNTPSQLVLRAVSPSIGKADRAVFRDGRLVISSSTPPATTILTPADCLLTPPDPNPDASAPQGASTCTTPANVGKVLP